MSITTKLATELYTELSNEVPFSFKELVELVEAWLSHAPIEYNLMSVSVLEQLVYGECNNSLSWGGRYHEVLYISEWMCIVRLGGEISLFSNKGNPYEPCGCPRVDLFKGLKAVKSAKKEGDSVFPCTEWGERMEKILERF